MTVEIERSMQGCAVRAATESLPNSFKLQVECFENVISERCFIAAQLLLDKT